MKEKLESETYI